MRRTETKLKLNPRKKEKKFYDTNLMNYLNSKKSREIIKEICNKHRLQKQISSIMKQNC